MVLHLESASFCQFVVHVFLPHHINKNSLLPFPQIPILSLRTETHLSPRYFRENRKARFHHFPSRFIAIISRKSRCILRDKFGTTVQFPKRRTVKILVAISHSCARKLPHHFTPKLSQILFQVLFQNNL